MRILVVDDDRDIREVLALLLESEGHDVEVAADGADALEKLRRGLCPAVVLLDMMMPRLDGEGLVRAMRADPHLASLPFIIVTGHHLGRQKAVQLGAVTCLVKPIELDA